MAVNWSYYNDDRFNRIDDKYLPPRGEGETKATQIVTAVDKLIYKWYNDGDVYDNQYFLTGWANNLSSYANWLRANTTQEVARVLDGIKSCYDGDDYEDLLKRIANILLDEEYLEQESKKPKVGSIYSCDGLFEFKERYEEWEDDDGWGDDEEW